MRYINIPYCGECCFVRHEGLDGLGYCNIAGAITHCGSKCVLDHTKMPPAAIAKALHYIQKWRRGAKTAMPHPYVYGVVTDAAIYQLRKIK